MSCRELAIRRELVSGARSVPDPEAHESVGRRGRCAEPEISIEANHATPLQHIGERDSPLSLDGVHELRDQDPTGDTAQIALRSEPRDVRRESAVHLP